jgi:hypothetical protein
MPAGCDGSGYGGRLATLVQPLTQGLPLCQVRRRQIRHTDTPIGCTRVAAAATMRTDPRSTVEGEAVFRPVARRSWWR